MYPYLIDCAGIQLPAATVSLIVRLFITLIRLTLENVDHVFSISNSMDIKVCRKWDACVFAP